MKTNRRQFLRLSATAGLAYSAIPMLGADNRDRKYRCALIGCGWWGNNILGEAMASGACTLVGLCDVDRRFLETTIERVKKEKGDEPKAYGDYRELLAKEKPDICIVATPDHWHALQTIDAVRAGAHVYVEKPISDIEEAHRSTNMSLLGMLSYKLGRSVTWDGRKTEVVGDSEANKLLRRDYRKGWEYPVAA